MQNFMIIIRAEEKNLNDFEGRAVEKAIKDLNEVCKKNVKFSLYQVTDDKALDRFEEEIKRTCKK